MMNVIRWTMIKKLEYLIEGIGGRLLAKFDTEYEAYLFWRNYANGPCVLVRRTTTTN